jgi:alpha-mannosidase
VLYADRPANYDAWDIDRHSLELGTLVTTPAQLRIEVNRRDRVVLAVRRRVGHASTMTMRYIVIAGEAVLRIEAEIDWREQHSLLKLHFPTAYRGASARFGAPFGSVLRGQQPGKPGDEAQWEVPGSRWAAVTTDGEQEGLALITEAKYGFSARDGELTVSLLRSTRVTGSEDDRYAAPRELARHRPDSAFSDQGRHLIRLAVASCDYQLAENLHPAALADVLFTDPVLYRGSPHSTGFIGVAGAPTLVATWAKPLNKKSWLLRLHEVGGRRGAAEIRLVTGWRIRRCGLDGTVEPAAPAIDEVSFGPYEIVSLRLEQI